MDLWVRGFLRGLETWAVASCGICSRLRFKACWRELFEDDFAVLTVLRVACSFFQFDERLLMSIALLPVEAERETVNHEETAGNGLT